MTQIHSSCPICMANVVFDTNIEESAMINCSECLSSLVVGKKQDGGAAFLLKAPDVDED